MLGYYALMGKSHAALSVLAVDIDPGKYKDKLPDSDDITDKGNDAASWLSARSGTFWTIIIILVVAALIAGALKKPFVRGCLIGIVLLAIALAVVNNV